MAHGLLHQNMLKEIVAKEPLEDQEVLQNAPRSGVLNLNLTLLFLQ